MFELRQVRLASNLLNKLIDFLKDRKQAILLNIQHSKWSNHSVQGFLKFSSLPMKLRFFFIAHGMNQSGISLNDDLKKKISNWAFQLNHEID